MVEGPLRRGRDRTLSAMVRLGAADAKTEQIALHLTADLVLERPFLGPDGEILGLGVVSAVNGDHARRRAVLNGAPLDAAETAIELTYRRPLSAGFFVQPDLQYIVHPGAAHGRADALLAGVRLGFAWSTAR
jgi:porin